MTAHQFSLSFAGNGQAMLILPQSMTIETLRLLEQEIIGALAEIRRDLCEDLARPGEVEYASWLQHLRPALRRETVSARQGAC